MTIRGYQLLALMALSLAAYTNAVCDKMTGCDDCTDPDPACITCSAGKFPSTDDTKKNECEDCQDNCKECATATTCATCNVAFLLITDGSCQACPASCDVCELLEGATDTTCTSAGCQTGKYNEAGACKNCPSNCVKCSNKDTCSTCDTDNNYVKNDDSTVSTGKQCLSCPAKCTACSGTEVSGHATCTACDDDHYVVSGDCTTCADTQCSKCVSDGTCEVDGCKEGYYKKEASAACALCDTHCDACETADSGTTCSDCSDLFGKKEKTAVTCDVCADSNCEACGTDVNTCVTCNTGYFVSSGSCTACFAGCTSAGCTGATADDCTACDETDGYKMISTTCTACADAHCTECSDAATCTACEAGWGVDTNDDCVKCHDLCNPLASTCTTALVDGCGVGVSSQPCADGAWSDSGDCTACDASCKTCVAATNAECDSCEDGVYNSDNTGGTCIACGDSNCKICSEATAAEKCTTCMPGFGESTTTAGTCVACHTGCTQCNTVNAECDATKCGTGYILLRNKKCAKCTDHCGDCAEHATADGTIECADDGCEAEYGVDASKVCQACPSNCDTCTATDGVMVCDTCMDNYRKNADECGKCPSNCADCNAEEGTMVCDVCIAGFAKDSENDCKACPSKCSECSAGTTVTCKAGKCQAGNGVSADKTACTDCATLTNVANCATCKDSNSTGFAECLSCGAGYFIQDDHMACLDVFAGCLASVDKSVECSTCEQGYNVTEDKRCFVMCNLCGGLGSGLKSVADCNAAGTEYTSAMCFGTCWTEYEDKEGTVTAARGCSTDECTSEYLDTEACSEVDEGKTKQCKSCCTEDNCNSKILDGKAGLSGSHAGIITANLWLLLVSVLALLTR